MMGSYNSLAQNTVAALYEYQCFQFKRPHKDAVKEVQLPHVSSDHSTNLDAVTNQTYNVHLRIPFVKLVRTFCSL